MAVAPGSQSVRSPPGGVMDGSDDLGNRPPRAGSAAAAIKEELFRIFYDQTAPQLMTFLRGHGASRPDAEDIIADTAILTWLRWDSIEDHRRWAYRVVSRAWIKRCKPGAEVCCADIDPGVMVTNSADEWVYEDDLLRLVDRLPPRQREVMLWKSAGFTPTEIAEELHLTAANVRANLMKARRSLYELLYGRSNQP
ncbi:RNA polymerase sigma factor [Nocardia tengchongensis]|uniref:RNA polymerase sigma factor n=1 Tax=Nocardia tengchongensis TaxID=2055889 RepID=UPI00368ABF12